MSRWASPPARKRRPRVRARSGSFVCSSCVPYSEIIHARPRTPSNLAGAERVRRGQEMAQESPRRAGECSSGAGSAGRTRIALHAGAHELSGGDRAAARPLLRDRSRRTGSPGPSGVERVAPAQAVARRERRPRLEVEVVEGSVRRREGDGAQRAPVVSGSKNRASSPPARRPLVPQPPSASAAATRRSARDGLRPAAGSPYKPIARITRAGGFAVILHSNRVRSREGSVDEVNGRYDFHAGERALCAVRGHGFAVKAKSPQREKNPTPSRQPPAIPRGLCPTCAWCCQWA